MKIDEKKWYKSKTLRTNALIITIGLASWMLGEINAGAAITIVGAINATLRIVTKEKLSW